jgi:hypothetical protein
MSVTAAPVVAGDEASDVAASAVEHIRVPPLRI